MGSVPVARCATGGGISLESLTKREGMKRLGNVNCRTVLQGEILDWNRHEERIVLHSS